MLVCAIQCWAAPGSFLMAVRNALFRPCVYITLLDLSELTEDRKKYGISWTMGAFTVGLYVKVSLNDKVIIVCDAIVMFLSHSYLLIYITVFIVESLGTSQRQTFDVLSVLMGMDCDFFEKWNVTAKVTLWSCYRAGKKASTVGCQMNNAIPSFSFLLFCFQKDCRIRQLCGLENSLIPPSSQKAFTSIYIYMCAYMCMCVCEQ